MTSSKTLGERIREARLERGMTQADLAAGDYTRAFISLVEHDRVSPSLKTLQLLASRLGKPISSFLEDVSCSRGNVLLLCNLATGYMEQDELEQAKPLLEQAEGYARKLGDQRLLGLVQMGFCRMYDALGDVDEAEARGASALGLLKRSGEAEDIARATMYAGNVSYRRRELYKALEHYKGALTILQSSDDNKRLLSRLYGNLGNVYLLQEDWDAAYEHYVKALELNAPDDDQRYRARTQMSLALAYRDRGDLDGALELSAKALEMFDMAQQPTMLADLYNGIASIHGRRRDYSTARYYYQKSLRVLKDAQVEQAVEAYRELASLDLKEGDLERASQQAMTALELATAINDPVEEAQCRLVYAKALVGLRGYREARKHLEQARAFFEEAGLQSSLRAALTLLKQIDEEVAEL